MVTSPIAPVNDTIPALGKTLRYVEWAILLAFIVTVFLRQNLYDTIFTTTKEYYIAYTYLGICALLSLFFPIARPLWQRRIYIFLEIFCLTIATILTTFELELFLYLLLAKSCFLLRRKEAIFLAIALGLIWHLVRLWSLSKTIERLIENADIYLENLADMPRSILIILSSHIVVYIAVSSFIILVCFLTIAEQKSRQKAIALAREVENLASALERTRIAREIHDSLGHVLTGLNVQLELVQRLQSKDPEKAKQALNTAKNLASQSLTEVRRSVATIRNNNFDLDTALINLVEQFKCDRNFKVDYRVNLPQLGLQTSHQLYCIVQEALTNIQKHSHASQITIQTRAIASETILEIIDDGIGFDLEEIRFAVRQLFSSGFGLRGMAERAEIIGAKINIETAPNRGTRIQIKIPFTGDSL